MTAHIRPDDGAGFFDCERVARWSYLAFALASLYLVQRSKNNRIPSENIVGMFSTLVPTELAHKLAAVHAAAAYWLHRRRVPLVSRWSGAAAVLVQGVVLAQLAGMYRLNLSSRQGMRRALAAAGVPREKLLRVGEMDWRRWLSVFLPLPQPLALAVSFPGVRKVRTVAYAYVGKLKTEPLLMDVYKHRDAPANAPVFVYIHGGGWVIGDRRIPPFALVHQVAALGWVVCVVDYRLSPKVSFPTHLIDCKRAVAFLRLHARLELQADAEFIVAGGESAGGHLAALLALTAEDKRFQPGFEEVDTSVRGCVDCYGVHDFKDRFGLWYARDKTDGMIRYLEFLIMQKKLRDAADDFERASPVAYLDVDGLGAADHSRRAPLPPFFVSHGTHDNTVPPQDSRLFFEHLQAFRAQQSDAHKAHTAAQFGGVRDVFLELPLTGHMFNFLVSPRSLAFGDAICAFLADLHAKTRARSPHSRFFPAAPDLEPVAVSASRL